MGSNVQEIFQGRGDKKGQGFRLIRALPPLVLALLWIGLLLNFPLTFPASWFSLASVAAIAYAVFHFVSKRRHFSVEFIFANALLVQGLINFSKIVWLKFAFFPALISLTSVYGMGTMIPISVLVPALRMKDAYARGAMTEELAFSLFLIAAVAAAGAIVNRTKKEKERAVSSLDSIKDNARNITLETGMESLDNEEIMSHYFASVTETDGEIRELLGTIKNAVLADAAYLFVPQGDRYDLRCSSEQERDVIITGKGVIPLCIRDKKVFFSPDLGEERTDPGYLKAGKVSSIIAVPIIDGSSPTGVLVTDSSRYQAFSQTEQNTVKMFASHLGRILERERIYMMIKRDVFRLKILKEESSNLIASLNSDVIIKSLCKAAEKIASSSAYFLLSKGEKFELAGGPQAITSRELGKVFDLSGTFVNMAIENRHTTYIADVTSYRIPITPFKTDGTIRSVIAIPMLYENKILGIFIMFSDKKNFLDTFQSDMLNVMCNQASASIANARLHEEIEKLATTDGLTGLFNHRVFQEKLSEQFRRLNRFSEPVSLLLTDIDFFKKVNDTFGHPTGDLVLKGVAGVIKAAIRDVDIPARYGGEEFAVILPGTNSEGARNIAERLRKNVMEKSFTEANRRFNVTVSIGIATCPTDAKTKEGLIEKADQALYHAKRNGRNQTVLRSSVGDL